MTRPLRSASALTPHYLDKALDRLRQARNWLRAADSPKALAAVQRAIRSAEGARRHARHRLARF